LPPTRRRRKRVGGRRGYERFPRGGLALSRDHGGHAAAGSAFERGRPWRFLLDKGKQPPTRSRPGKVARELVLASATRIEITTERLKVMDPNSLLLALDRMCNLRSAAERLPVEEEQGRVMELLHDSIGMTDDVFRTVSDMVFELDLPEGVTPDVAFALICSGMAVALMAAQYEATGNVPLTVGKAGRAQAPV
jgi:hypothetical protein